jgi:hypothetical protein
MIVDSPSPIVKISPSNQLTALTSVKLEVLESIVAPKLRSGRFKATDKLIASLKPQNFMRRK